jgi:hypothetical protein
VCCTSSTLPALAASRRKCATDALMRPRASPCSSRAAPALIFSSFLWAVLFAFDPVDGARGPWLRPERAQGS